MIKLDFHTNERDGLNILLLGAHSDDIEIGCGGAILRLIREYSDVEIAWVVFSAIGERGHEAERSAEEFLKNVSRKQILVEEFKDGYFPSSSASIKDIFENLKSKIAPDIIFTHYRHDMHQDHRQICELTWNTWRNHFILEYEIPKYDGDLGAPNFFITLDDDLRKEKVNLLMRYFQTQGNKHWFTPETFNALLRLRGIESKSPGGFSEGFYCRKMTY